MAEVFDNSKPIDIEEMTDSQFENWTRDKQNEMGSTIYQNGSYLPKWLIFTKMTRIYQNGCC